MAVPPDTDTCDTILAVDRERGKVEVGRETWEALAVRLGMRQSGGRKRNLGSVGCCRPLVFLLAVLPVP